MIAGKEWRRGLLLVVTAGLRASGSDWRRGLERATSSFFRGLHRVLVSGGAAATTHFVDVRALAVAGQALLALSVE